MKGRIVFALAIALAALLALVALGGVGYHRETAYVEIVSPPITNETRVPEVLVSSARKEKTGLYEFLAFSKSGPPFELQMFGTAPAASTASTCQVVSLVVKADDATVLSVSNQELPLNVKMVTPEQSSTSGFSFSAPSFLSGTPPRLRVRGTLRFPSAAGDATVSFERALELHKSKRIVVGSFTWYL